MPDPFDNDTTASQLAPVRQVSKLNSGLAITPIGVVLPATMTEVVELAQFMCKSDKAIPAFMRGNPGECMAVIMDAVNWAMNPWSLARQRYVVNDIGAYMSQVIAAVVKSRAPIAERVIAPIYSGDGQSLQCAFKLHHADTGEEITYESPRLADIKPQNSPLWKSEPKQQLYYYSMRALARRHFPDLLLGVYDIEEAHAMRDVTPKEKTNLLHDPDDAPAPTVHTFTGHNVGSDQSERVIVRDGEVIPPERKERIDHAIEREAHEQRERDEGVEEIERVFGPDDPAGMDDRQLAEDKIKHDPETGEIVADASPGLFEQAANDGKITPERMFKNLADGARSCKTVKDYETWRKENMTPETRKQIGEQWWKALAPILADVEDKVGFL